MKSTVSQSSHHIYVQIYRTLQMEILFSPLLVKKLVASQMAWYFAYCSNIRKLHFTTFPTRKIYYMLKWIRGFLLLRKGQVWGRKYFLECLLSYHYAFRAKDGLGRETYLVSRPRKSCLSWVRLNTIEMGRKNLNFRSPERSLTDSFREKHFLIF